MVVETPTFTTTTVYFVRHGTTEVRRGTPVVGYASAVLTTRAPLPAAVEFAREVSGSD